MYVRVAIGPNTIGNPWIVYPTVGHEMHPQRRCIDDFFFFSLFSNLFTADISALESGSRHEDLAFMYY